MGEFQRVAISTEASQLVDTALDKYAEELEARGIVGWVPNEGNPEVILINVIAPMAANAALIESVLLEAAFRQFGTKLLKLLYNEGAAATVTAKFKLLEEGGEFPARTIPAGFQLEGSGLAFYVEKEVKVAKGEKEATVIVVASERGTEGNGVTSLTPVNNLNFLSEVVVVGETTGGANQETDATYMNRLASQLELQAPRPITAANFAQMALGAPASILPSGVVVGRATAIDGYNPEAHKFKAKIENGKTSVTAVTSFTGVSPESKALPQIHPGSELSGVGIVAGTTVVSVNEGAKTLVLSKAATKTEETEITATGSYENQRTVTVFVTNPQGLALTTEAREKLLEWLETLRELGFLIYVESAKYSKVYVTGEIHALPGYVAATVAANVKSSVESYLSPATYGNPTGATTGSNVWLNATQGFNLVRYNQIIEVMGAVQGVAYVPAGSAGLAIGLSVTPTETLDLTLPGAAPLPLVEPAQIIITAV